LAWNTALVPGKTLLDPPTVNVNRSRPAVFPGILPSSKSLLGLLSGLLVRVPRLHDLCTKHWQWREFAGNPGRVAGGWVGVLNVEIGVLNVDIGVEYRGGPRENPS
jgi:hypothetical protein